MFISFSDAPSKVWQQEHFPTLKLNSVALHLKLLCGILTSDKGIEKSKEIEIKAVTSCSTHKIDQQETDG